MQCDFGDRTKAFRQGIKFLIDNNDYEKFVKDYRFCLSVVGYVVYSSKKDGLNGKLLHRIIMGDPDGQEVDHINVNPLDNRRENLRICSHHENSFNRTKYSNNKSGFKGVYFDKQKQKFRAYINIDGKRKYLGYFDDPEEAHQAYCKAAIKLHGEFARF